MNEANVCKMALALQLAHSKSTLQKQLDKALAAHQLSVSEFLLLHTLCADTDSPCAQGENMRPISQVQLADMLSLTASAITKMLAVMEKNGLTLKTRHEKDARVSLVSVTDHGKNIYQQAWQIAKHELDYFFARLNDKEQAQLLQLLQKI